MTELVINWEYIKPYLISQGAEKYTQKQQEEIVEIVIFHLEWCMHEKIIDAKMEVIDD